MQAEAPESTPPPPRSSPPPPLPSTSAGATTTYEVAFLAAAEPGLDQGLQGSSLAREVTLVVCGERGDTGPCLIKLAVPERAAEVHTLEAPSVGRMASVWVGHDGRSALRKCLIMQISPGGWHTACAWSLFLALEAWLPLCS